MTQATIVLLSGVDSAVLLHHLARTTEVVPLFIDYGQRAAKQERAFALAQCESLGLGLVCLDIASVGNVFEANQASKPHIPLPHRNLVLLSLALSYAARINAATVALSVIRDDVEWYASASTSFLDALRAVAITLGAATIDTPFITYDKLAVVGEGLRLGVKLEQTYSCMLGYDLHCGRWHQCTARRNSLAQAGAFEPVGFYRNAP